MVASTAAGVGVFDAGVVAGVVAAVVGLGLFQGSVGHIVFLNIWMCVVLTEVLTRSSGLRLPC